MWLVTGKALQDLNSDPNEGISKPSVPISAMFFSARSLLQHSHSAAALDAVNGLVALSNRLADGPDWATAAELGLFELGILAESDHEERPTPEEVDRLDKWARTVVTSGRVDCSWWPWWDNITSEADHPLPPLEVLTRLGESKLLHRQPTESIARRILEMYRDDRSRWQLLRLSLSSRSSLIGEVTNQDLLALSQSAEDSRVGTMANCIGAAMTIIGRERCSRFTSSPLIDTRFSAQWLLSVGRLSGARMDVIAEIGASLALEDLGGSTTLISHARSQLLENKPILSFGPAV